MNEQEHVYLGARFNEDKTVAYYGPQEDGASEFSAILHDVGLFDCSLTQLILVDGPGASDFVHMVCASAIPSPGEFSPSAVLSGDGMVIAEPYIACFDRETFIFAFAHDMTSKEFPVQSSGGTSGQALEESSETSNGTAQIDLLTWLEQIAAIENNGEPVFGDFTLAPINAKFDIFLLIGPKAYGVLEDYLANEEHAAVGKTLTLPQVSMSLMLDSTPALIFKPKTDAFMIAIPRQYGEVFWRSFLSFDVISPIGTRALEQADRTFEGLILPLPYGAHRLDQLCETGVIRHPFDFIGGKALAKNR